MSPFKEKPNTQVKSSVSLPFLDILTFMSVPLSVLSITIGCVVRSFLCNSASQCTDTPLNALLHRQNNVDKQCTYQNLILQCPSMLTRMGLSYSWVEKSENEIKV